MLIKRSAFIEFTFTIPNILSLFRLFSVPVLFFTILFNAKIMIFFIFLISILSDFFDGLIARRWNQCSYLGSYLDVIADFILVFFSILAFVLRGVYPFWILILMIIMFFQFLITSKKYNEPIYDPLGKYYGAFLMIMILASIIDIYAFLINVIPCAILIYTIFCIISRAIFLFKGITPKK